MSQRVASVTIQSNVATNDSSSNSVSTTTTSVVTTISPCSPQPQQQQQLSPQPQEQLSPQQQLSLQPQQQLSPQPQEQLSPQLQQQLSPPESSVSPQHSQLPSCTEGFQQPKIKLLTRPQAVNGTPVNEVSLNHQAIMITNVEQLSPSGSNVIVDGSSGTEVPVITPTMAGEKNKEWQPSMGLVLPSERCDDENPSVNLQEFLCNAMRSPQDNRDRVFLLQLESMFTSYINNQMQTSPITLPPDTSYHRMLAHRVAAYFGLKHSVDSTGNSVVVWKIAESKVPHSLHIAVAMVHHWLVLMVEDF